MIPKKPLKIRGMGVNEFDYIRVSIASPEQILEWSYGEVKKAETINHRTHKPEKDGLFCAKIFGPINDYECLCGKYKRKKHKGVICERCGVEVTEKKVRRERMGHIKLVSPVAHIWYLKGPGSKIALVLDLDQKDLERVVYFERYVVLDPGKAGDRIKKGQVLSEKEYRELEEEFGYGSFVAKMGAEAIKELLSEIDIDSEVEKLRKLMKEEKREQKRSKLAKRLRAVEAFKYSGNKPEWMIIDILPVLPPDLRPLVRLESGTFASSDLNELYRRILNRNNRLKKLIEQNAPDIIVKNEKRMLQEAVDALFENGARGKTYLSSNNRPLKSLSDSLKGKTGRFRQNLLGKRVDYSGRSVIVVNPKLKLNQCGLPKRMALELFRPFVIRKLEEKGYAGTVAEAKEAIEDQKPEVWECLEEVVKNHPVMLNRAPTLHRLSIQSFFPVLIEGEAIQIHPLVCPAFNADFDGDQMAVHVPLSIEAQVENREIMLSSLNILSPAHGKPIAMPTQDMVLGVYYLTILRKGRKGEGMLFASKEDAISTYMQGFVDLNAKILLRFKGKIKNIETFANPQDIANCPTKEIDGVIETTPGRIILNQALPEEMPYINGELKKKGVQNLVFYAYEELGLEETVRMLDSLKELGFEYATKAGFSIGIDDMMVPPNKWEIIEAAEREIEEVEKHYKENIISQSEKHNNITSIWERVTHQVTFEMRKNIIEHMERTGELNSLLIMAESGARGKIDQVRQLAAMRGLMAKPSGEIIETPVKSNFREGLSPIEYFISTHGARKGSADTALKTAEAGYLTRRLVDVSQDVIVSEEDCGTTDGFSVSAIIENGEIIVPFYDRILGRTSLEKVIDPDTKEVIVDVDEEIDEDKAKKIVDLGLTSLKIRSILTCKSRHGVCAKCYGRNLALKKPVDLGEAVGIIAAQSIGEPGTQLTMRTFHTGGVAAGVAERNKLSCNYEGTIKLENVKYVEDKDGNLIVIKRRGYLYIIDHKGREKESYEVPYGAKLLVKEGDKVSKGSTLFEWDPYANPILTSYSGIVKFKDIIKDITMVEVVDEITGYVKNKIIKSKDEKKTPVIAIIDKDNPKKTLEEILLPAEAFLEVKEGDEVYQGTILAKIPREKRKTKDITGGLPRAEELFEARRPKEPAAIAEIDGVVHIAGFEKSARKIVIENKETGEKKETKVPKSAYLLVSEGEEVKAGDILIDGAADPHMILTVLGEKETANYLLKEIQEVYRSQGVEINDKHLEVIIRQMMKWVRVEEVGDSRFYSGQIVDKFEFEEENRRLRENGEVPAKGEPTLLGISKAALNTYSFISAASFQETTKVLTDAAFFGKEDYLQGLKENVIMGRLIPAGTGFPQYQDIEIRVIDREEHEEKEEA